MPTALQAEGITAGYGKVPVVWEIAARAESGKVVAILGPNGSGKSTFMKAITGQIHVDAGAVSVAGKDVTGLPGHLIARTGLGYLPPLATAFPRLTPVD